MARHKPPTKEEREAAMKFAEPLNREKVTCPYCKRHWFKEGSVIFKPEGPPVTAEDWAERSKESDAKE